MVWFKRHIATGWQEGGWKRSGGVAKGAYIRIRFYLARWVASQTEGMGGREMTEQELREKICEVIDSGISIGEMADYILILIKEAGYVQLDPDQSLPENPYEFIKHPDTEHDSRKQLCREVYFVSGRDMLKAGWRRVILEVKE